MLYETMFVPSASLKACYEKELVYKEHSESSEGDLDL